jgi:hypothetical protein
MIRKNVHIEESKIRELEAVSKNMNLTVAKLIRLSIDAFLLKANQNDEAAKR